MHTINAFAHPIETLSNLAKSVYKVAELSYTSLSNPTKGILIQEHLKMAAMEIALAVNNLTVDQKIEKTAETIADFLFFGKILHRVGHCERIALSNVGEVYKTLATAQMQGCKFIEASENLQHEAYELAYAIDVKNIEIGESIGQEAAKAAGLIEQKIYLK
jgi:hypothetical protein